MNRLANLLGYLAGYRAANRTGYQNRTDSATESRTYSPHVRAIASRPVPASPFQTSPVLGGFSYLNKQISTAKEPFSVDAEVARRMGAREAVAS